MDLNATSADPPGEKDPVDVNSLLLAMRRFRRRRLHRIKTQTLPQAIAPEALAVPVSMECTPLQPQDHEELGRLDREFLQHLLHLGFLTVLPHNKDVPAAPSHNGPYATAASGGRGTVTMVSDPTGHAARPTPPGQDRVGRTTYDRWMALAHEASHCEFVQQLEPFASDRMPLATADALNAWVFLALYDSTNDYRRLFNECFADTYGALMLLEASGHSSGAVAAIHRQMKERTELRVRRENSTVKGSWTGPTGSVFASHGTDFAMDRLMRTRSQWANLSIEDKKAFAQQCASEGFLDVVDPQRKTPDGEPIGAFLLAGMAHIIPQGERFGGQIQRCLRALCRAFCDGDNPADYLASFPPTHALGTMMQDAWKVMEPKLADWLAQDPHRESLVRGNDKEAYADLLSLCLQALKETGLEDKALSERGNGPRNDAIQHIVEGLHMAPVLVQPFDSQFGRYKTLSFNDWREALTVVATTNPTADRPKPIR